MHTYRIFLNQNTTINITKCQVLDQTSRNMIFYTNVILYKSHKNKNQQVTQHTTKNIQYT